MLPCSAEPHRPVDGGAPFACVEFEQEGWPHYGGTLRRGTFAVPVRLTFAPKPALSRVSVGKIGHVDTCVH